MSDNKVVSSAEYTIVDASPELAKADLSVPASGADITHLIHQSKCCGGGCKKS